MRGHNICFYAEITKVILNYLQILTLTLYQELCVMIMHTSHYTCIWTFGKSFYLFLGTETYEENLVDYVSERLIWWWTEIPITMYFWELKKWIQYMPCVPLQQHACGSRETWNMPEEYCSNVCCRYTFNGIALNRGSSRSDHFIWNLWNKPFASFINFIWNDHECKILFIILPLKMRF